MKWEHSRPESREPRPRGYPVAGTICKRAFEPPLRLRSLFECLMEVRTGGLGYIPRCSVRGRTELRPGRARSLSKFQSTNASLRILAVKPIMTHAF
jgi:hypothetical protein